MDATRARAHGVSMAVSVGVWFAAGSRSLEQEETWELLYEEECMSAAPLPVQHLANET